MKTLHKGLIAGTLVVAFVLLGTSSALAAAELSLDKSSNVNMSKGGEVVTFTVTVENTGDATAENVEVTDALNARFTLIDQLHTDVEASETLFAHSTSRLDWNLGDLEAGEEVTLSYRVITPFLSSDMVITNTVEAEADNVAMTSVADDITIKETDISEINLNDYMEWLRVTYGLSSDFQGPAIGGPTQLPSTGMGPLTLILIMFGVGVAVMRVAVAHI